MVEFFCDYTGWVFWVGMALCVVGGFILNARNPSFEGESYKMAGLGTGWLVLFILLTVFARCD